MTTNFCPHCFDDREATLGDRELAFNVRGESIVIRGTVPVCSTCGNVAADVDLENEHLLSAYREYRRRHDLLQPEEIAAIRTQYGLSQRAMSRLLGWGQITVQRYERGALQDVTHNRTMVAMRDPHYVIGLLKDPSCKLTDMEREEIRASLENNTKVSLRKKAGFALEELLTSEEPSLFTGYRRPDLERIGKMMVYFAQHIRGDLFRVKLMKLLFYADFLHFARQGVSISGFPYKRFAMGPVVEDYDSVLAWMSVTGFAMEDEVPTSAQPGLALVPLTQVEDGDFTPSEMDDMSYVIDCLGSKTGTELKDLSHREPAWLNTDPFDRISYSWASDLVGLKIRLGEH